MSNNTKQRLHFIGVCGKGMAPIAAALAREGWRVTGSDEGCYAPMSDYLVQAGLVISTPYNEHNIPADTDLVVVGKRVTEDNPELQWVMRNGFDYCSFPQFLNRHFLMNSRNAVVAGALGKTTTTAMLAWILEHAGRSPNYFVGGLADNLKSPARLRSGAAIAVLEGDEYASCFDDRQPKFMHYRPEGVLVTNVLEDHPDLYDGMESLLEVFIDLVKLLPESGCLVLSEDDEATPRLRREAGCRVISVGSDEMADERIEDVKLEKECSRFRFGGVEFKLGLFGRMNVKNAAMAAALADHFGVSYAESALAMAEFKGIANRQEKTLVGSHVLVSDKATHPSALRGFLQSLRQQFPGRRVVLVIQPRATGGQDWVYQKQLPGALAGADEVMLLPSYEHRPGAGRVWKGGNFSLERLHQELVAVGTACVVLMGGAGLSEALMAGLKPGDVVALSLLEQSRHLLGVVEQALGRSPDTRVAVDMTLI
ncbi:hypothetical protein FEM03_09860 [Phragmitibacter flavus]|uniref:UDP-N-acetylmuramate:L-alanyl-gamma-D-glutamyl-meso-diaminopimelate ligase n=1 Tax=Phragmitibacter flavus TaxID=2576071 RepID=A0A5R8KHW2_9BACT|nr:Mur ligase family protein [Phragmitibacter flavus]TLD71199.1 hypothetical protein FEM03_09860 [Phragmitibacter flavus]